MAENKKYYFGLDFGSTKLALAYAIEGGKDVKRFSVGYYDDWTYTEKEMLLNEEPLPEEEPERILNGIEDAIRRCKKSLFCPVFSAGDEIHICFGIPYVKSEDLDQVSLCAQLVKEAIERTFGSGSNVHIYKQYEQILIADAWHHEEIQKDANVFVVDIGGYTSDMAALSLSSSGAPETPVTKNTKLGKPFSKPGCGGIRSTREIQNVVWPEWEALPPKDKMMVYQNHEKAKIESITNPSERRDVIGKDGLKEKALIYENGEIKYFGKKAVDMNAHAAEYLQYIREYLEDFVGENNSKQIEYVILSGGEFNIKEIRERIGNDLKSDERFPNEPKMLCVQDLLGSNYDSTHPLSRECVVAYGACLTAAGKYSNKEVPKEKKSVFSLDDFLKAVLENEQNRDRNNPANE